jgi:hypothetical protein
MIISDADFIGKVFMESLSFYLYLPNQNVWNHEKSFAAINIKYFKWI